MKKDTKNKTNKSCKNKECKDCQIKSDSKSFELDKNENNSFELK